MCKKLLIGMLAAAALLATSCIYDGLETPAPEEQSRVSFTLDLEGAIATRAISDGKSVNKLFYSIYKVEKNENGEEVAVHLQKFVGSDEYGRGVKNDFVSGETVTVTLAKEQTYRAVFWAQDDACTAYDTKDLTNVHIDYASAPNNDENRDAFCAVTEFVADAGVTCDVVLRRPFAQVNVGVLQSDWDQAMASGFTVKESSVVIKNAATSLNLLTGAVGPETDDVEVSYSAADIPAEVLKVETDDTQEGKESYVWLSMSYILVADHNDVAGANGMLGDESATLESAEFTFVPENGANIVLSDGLTNIPVQRNWRTNILGTLLAGSVDFTITIDPAYYNDSNVIQIADGVIADEEDGTFYIFNPNGMKWLSENLTARDGFAGKTVKLKDDIDLSASNWDPIGNNGADEAFKGTFDGQDHLISGAHISGDHCWNGSVYGSSEGWGLFALTDGATIKNLKVEDAAFGSYTVITGTIAGYANNTTFENIEISNTQIAGYNWYTGGVVGWAAGDCTFRNVNLDNTVKVGTLWDSHGQCAGGIAGGISSSSNITIEDCNIACVMDVINDVTSNYKWYIYRVSGMIIGNISTTQEIDGKQYPDPSNVTCERVTVTYGEWMNYHYCQGYGNRGWARVEESEYVGGVDYTQCNHPDGEQHCLCLTFDQLFGGGPNGGGRSPVYGLKSFDGVTVIYPSEYTCSVCGQQHNVPAGTGSGEGA